MARLEVIEMWRGEDVLAEILDGIDYGLAYAARDIVYLDKPTTAVATGTLQRSKRTAPPHYEANDLQEAMSRDLFVEDIEHIRRQVIDHAIAVGSWIPYAYTVEMGASNQQAQPSTLPAADSVADNMDEYVRTGIEHTQRTI